MLRSAHIVYEVCDHQRARRSIDHHALLQSEAVDGQFLEDTGKGWLPSRVVDPINAQIAVGLLKGPIRQE